MVSIITPSTSFIQIDSVQSPFTTVLLSTVGYPGQIVTVLDRSGTASDTNYILISSFIGSNYGFSTLIDQPSGFVTLQAQNTSTWSYINTFPFWNQRISSGVSFLTTSTLYTTVNSTAVETLSNVMLENLILTGPLPPVASATFIQNLTVTSHTEILSSFRANDAFRISSPFSTFSQFLLASSLTVQGPISVQSTLTTLSTLNVSSLSGIAVSTGLFQVTGSLQASTIEVQRSTGFSLVPGPLVIQQGVLGSSITIGGSVSSASLSVGSFVSTTGTLVASTLAVSANLSTGSLYEVQSLVAGNASFYGVASILSSLNAITTNFKNSLYLDTSLQASTATVQAVSGQSLTNGLLTTGQLSTQTLNTTLFAASSTQILVQTFSTQASFLALSTLTAASSFQVQGPLVTSTLSVGCNVYVQGAVQVRGSIAFTSSLTLLSSANVNLLTTFSTAILGNLTVSTLSVGSLFLSSFSLPPAATVTELSVSTLQSQGLLSTATLQFASQILYVSSLGIGFASTPYNLQLAYSISTQTLTLSSLSTLQVLAYGNLQLTSTMAVGMSSLGSGLDVGGLAKINGFLSVTPTVSSQSLIASSITGIFYGDAANLFNFRLQTVISSFNLAISSLQTYNTSTGLFMGSSGSMIAPLTLISSGNTESLLFQGNSFVKNIPDNTTYYSPTNQIQAHNSGSPFLQLNNSLFISSGCVGINVSTPKYTLHVEKTLAIGGLAGATFSFRSVTYNTLQLSTLTNTGSANFLNYGFMQMPNLGVDASLSLPYYQQLFAGTGVLGYKEGPVFTAVFNQPNNLCFDSNGVIFVADRNNSVIRKIENGVVSLFAGSPGVIGSTNGTGSNARFYFPQGLAFDSNGNLYVSDSANHLIRKITPGGVVTTFTGSGFGSTNGGPTVAKFKNPNGLSFDTAGNMYVADATNNMIRKVDTNGNVTTFAGQTTSGYTNANGTAAQFKGPQGLVFDSQSNLFVTDQSNYAIRKITPAGDVTTFAGAFPASSGTTDGNGTNAQFNFPINIAIDSRGNIFICDQWTSQVRKITPAADVTKVIGTGTPYYRNSLWNYNR